MVLLDFCRHLWRCDLGSIGVADNELCWRVVFGKLAGRRGRGSVVVDGAGMWYLYFLIAGGRGLSLA